MEMIGECPTCKAPVYGPSTVGFESVELMNLSWPKVLKVEGQFVVVGGHNSLETEDWNIAPDMEAYNRWSGSVPSGEWSVGE